MLEKVTAYLASLGPEWFYLALFVSAYIENIFPPVPGDTVVVFAAYIVGRSQQRFVGVFIATTLGSVSGFMTYYWIGRLFHPEYFIRRNFRILPAASFESAGRWFQRWGNWVILLNRFLSGIRSVISIVCGLYRLPWPRVLALCSIGCAIWNLALIWAGYLLGANWRMIDAILHQYSRILLIIGVLVAGLWLIRRKVSASHSRE